MNIDANILNDLIVIIAGTFGIIGFMLGMNHKSTNKNAQRSRS